MKIYKTTVSALRMTSVPVIVTVVALVVLVLLALAATSHLPLPSIHSTPFLARVTALLSQP